MNRILLSLALCLVTAPGYSMTATVPPGASSGSPAARGPTANAATADAATKAATTAATGNPAPTAASVTRPAAVLSAPGVPMKASAASGARSGVAPSKSTVFMPGPNSKSGAMAPAPNSAGWTRAANQKSDMRRGTLQSVNAGTFQVFGQKLNFNPQQVKVFNRDGRPGSIYTLKRGAKVRFMLDPKDPAQRRVSVIYVD